MVGGSLIEGLSELGIQQILLKIAALWGAVFFETKKTQNTVTQGSGSQKLGGSWRALLCAGVDEAQAVRLLAGWAYRTGPRADGIKRSPATIRPRRSTGGRSTPATWG